MTSLLLFYKIRLKQRLFRESAFFVANRWRKEVKEIIVIALKRTY